MDAAAAVGARDGAAAAGVAAGAVARADDDDNANDTADADDDDADATPKKKPSKLTPPRFPPVGKQSEHGFALISLSVSRMRPRCGTIQDSLIRRRPLALAAVRV